MTPADQQASERTTQADMARVLGISQVTVHRALTGHGDVKPDTRKRVMELARNRGYRLNTSASSLRRGRFGAIALLKSTEPGRSSFQGTDGIHDALAEEDMQLVVARLPDEKLTSRGVVPKILREWCADGLLISYTDHIPPKMIELIGEYRIASVWMNARFEQDCVFFDDCTAGREATEHLLSLGHRDIVYVDLSYAWDNLENIHYSALDRAAGYEQAMVAAGLTPRTIRGEHHVHRSGRAAWCAEWLANVKPRPTAIVAYAESTAFPLYVGAVRNGLAVPMDLSLITFAHSHLDAIGVQMSHLDASHDELGKAGAEMLLDRIASPVSHGPPRAIPFRLREPGNTVAAPTHVENRKN